MKKSSYRNGIVHFGTLYILEIITEIQIFEKAFFKRISASEIKENLSFNETLKLALLQKKRTTLRWCL